MLVKITSEEEDALNSYSDHALMSLGMSTPEILAII